MYSSIDSYRKPLNPYNSEIKDKLKDVQNLSSETYKNRGKNNNGSTNYDHLKAYLNSYENIQRRTLEHPYKGK